LNDGGKTLTSQKRNGSLVRKVENIIDDRGSDLSEHDPSPKSPFNQDNFKTVNLPLNNDLRSSLALTNKKNN
jgi:hypothetical protein